MARVFEPRKAIYVPATGGHPKNTEYRIAWGIEKWDKPTNVTKVQMVYNGNVAGMLSPSYPDDTVDEIAVSLALKLIKENHGTNSKTIKDILVVKELKEGQILNRLIDEASNEVGELHLNIIRSKNPNFTTLAYNSELKENPIKIENNLFGFLFRIEIL
jgi:hypothetical protein